ncbi:MAG: glycosyltransferase family 2 protein [Solirubrobacterales bacterium]|nr:glycosyltransferase family 2 protein [Solirubrobacterales bacterium]
MERIEGLPLAAPPAVEGTTGTAAAASRPASVGTALTVIVPATNEPPTLGRCLQAIREADEPPERLLVVTDPPLAGPAFARNTAAAMATEDVLVFVDADVLVRPDAFRRMRERLDADPGLAAVFGSYDDEPEDLSLVSRFRNLLHHHVHHEAAGPVATFWAGLGAVRRDAFFSVAGFDDERFAVPSVEDIDLGMRLSAAGHRIDLDPSIQGKHLKRWTLRSMLRTDFAHRGVPWTALMTLKRSPDKHLNLGWSHRVSALLSVLASGAALVALAAVLLTALAPAAVAAAVATGSVLGLARVNSRLVWLLATKSTALAVVGLGLLMLHYLAAAASILPGIALGMRWRRIDADRPPRAAAEVLAAPDLMGTFTLATAKVNVAGDDA